MRRRNVATTLGLAVFVATACAHDLPARVASDVQDRSAYRLVDDAVYAQMKTCAAHLDGLRDDAEHRYALADYLLVGGGATAATGAGVAGFMQAADTPSKTVTAVSAAVAAAGGLLALSAKTIEDPQKSLGTRSLAEKHYAAGFKAVSVLQFPDGEDHGYIVALNRYAFLEFKACEGSQPSDSIPPLPEAPPAHGVGSEGRDAGVVDVDASVVVHDGGTGRVGAARGHEMMAVSMPPVRALLSPGACTAACQALCERKRRGPSAVVGHFCSQDGAGWRACVGETEKPARCNDPSFLGQ